MDESSIKLELPGLPGFRFHPTEEELLNFYLKNTILGKKLHNHVIGILNIYRHDPWFLPGLAKIGEREWYFFVPRDRKHGSGGRPNRTTEHGFWKATGSDRKIVSLSEPKRVIGLKKTLVFYKGRAPRGTKTDWVMNEYRLPPDSNIIKDKAKDIVLCKIYRKATSLKVLEQRAAKEEEEEMNKTSTNIAIPPPPPPPLISMDYDHTITYSSSQHELDLVLKKEDEEEDEDEGMLISQDNFLNDAAAAAEAAETNKSTTLQLPTGMENLGLQLPKLSTQVDPFHTPLCSPWLDNWLIPYANILNL